MKDDDNETNHTRQRRQLEPTEHLQIVTSGGNIRLEPAQSSRGTKQDKQNVIINMTQDISPVGGFLDFLKQHAVVGLIIGFVIGNQVTSIVKQLISSFVDPLTKLLFGTALSNRTFVLHLRGRSATFDWGALVYVLVIFLFVLITMYLAVKLLKLDKLEKEDKKKESS
jgi:large-conductance mechanosensitive channel